MPFPDPHRDTDDELESWERAIAVAVICLGLLIFGSILYPFVVWLRTD